MKKKGQVPNLVLGFAVMIILAVVLFLIIRNNILEPGENSVKELTKCGNFVFKGSCFDNNTDDCTGKRDKILGEGFGCPPEDDEALTHCCVKSLPFI